MAAFAASFEILQSSDGLTLTINDTSNYTVNDEDYVIADFLSREVLLLDAYGDEITTIDLGSLLTADYAITRDTWVNGTLNLTGVDPVPDYTKNLLFPFDRITKNLYRALLKNGCCSNILNEQALSAADRFFRGSEISAISGDGPGFQSDIDAAYAYLNPYNV